MALAVLAREEIVARQERRGIGSEIGEDEAADLLRLVGRMLDAVFERAAFGLRRLLDTFAGKIVEPAVIAAAEAAVFDTAELERSPAMRAMEAQKPELAVARAEQHEILAEQSDFRRAAFLPNVLAKSHGPPVAPQHLAAGRAAPDARQKLILFLRKHRLLLLKLQHLGELFLELQSAVLALEIECDGILRLLKLDPALFHVPRHLRPFDKMGRDELVFFEQRLPFLRREKGDEELREVRMGGAPRHAELEVRRQDRRRAGHGDERRALDRNSTPLNSS